MIFFNIKHRYLLMFLSGVLCLAITVPILTTAETQRQDGLHTIGSFTHTQHVLEHSPDSLLFPARLEKLMSVWVRFHRVNYLRNTHGKTRKAQFIFVWQPERETPYETRTSIALKLLISTPWFWSCELDRSDEPGCNQRRVYVDSVMNLRVP